MTFVFPPGEKEAKFKINGTPIAHSFEMSILGKRKREYDLRFENPCAFILAGPTMSGKTTFVFNLLRHIDTLFVNPKCKQNVLYFYNRKQDGFDLFKKENIVKEWIHALPSTDQIEEKTEAYKNRGGSVVIIDDFMDELNKDTAQIFTSMRHHLDFVLILMIQNLFSSNPVFRTISLNATYILIFKNVRDASQIQSFAKQFAPGEAGWVVNAFKNATRRAHSYVLFDCNGAAPYELKIRSHMLPHELPIRVYMDKSTSREQLASNDVSTE